MSAPLFSVITPVFRPPIGFFLDCVQSVVDQTCRDWELVLVDDGNDSAELLAAMANLETGHEAIRVVRSTRNVGIAAASQLGLAAATGQFVALLDHDDLLTPDALERVAEMLESAPDTDYLYTDEDKIGEDGEFYDPSFKPDWSPERFRSHMYTCHLSVVRRKLALESGGFRRGFEGSQDYDFILRVTERARRVVHLPEIHYHWRAHVGSTALHALQKPEAYAAAKRALTEHCQRVGIEADVLDGVTIGGYRVARRLTSRPLVSLVIPTKGSVAPVRGRDEVLVKHLIESIERRTTYDNFEYVVVHDARMAGNVASEVRESCGHAFVAVPYAYDDDSFNFSEAVNRGVARARGDIIVLLNDDMELITPDWLDEFVGLLTDADVGAVGGKYFFADESIQHAGVCLVGAPSHMFYRMPRGTNQILGLHLTVTREVSALTGACLAVSRANFLAVGGFTEQLPINYNDVDFCLKLRSRGLRNVWTPYVELYHFESQTREPGRVDQLEYDVMARRWGALRSDPYYNPNLEWQWPRWVPYSDWRSVTRGWQRVVDSVVTLDRTSYLDANPDLAAEVAADPAWDVVGHFLRHGEREGRAQTTGLRLRSMGSA